MSKSENKSKKTITDLAGKPLRGDRQHNLDRLVGLVAQTITDEGQDYRGHMWAVRPQDDWAAMLGATVRTVGRLIKLPPIVTCDAQAEGRRVILLRIGQPNDSTAPAEVTDDARKHIVNTMAKIFRTKTGHAVAGKGYGCLNGLHDALPAGKQIAIFKTVLNDWPAFKAGVAIEVEKLIAEGNEKAHHRRHDYPSPSIILRFHKVAEEMHLMALQESGAAPLG